MKIELIDQWRSAWRLYTFWMSVIVAVMPDLLNLAISHGIITVDEVPGWFSYTLKCMTFAWMAARLIKQESLKQASQTQ
jgi:hypothetical protein